MDIGRGHAEILMDLIQEVLSRASIGYRDLELLGATCGPGSFAGVRVGLATTRGLQLALDIPAVGISTLEGLAEAGRADGAKGLLLSLAGAGRDEAYFQFFCRESDKIDNHPGVASYDEIADMLANSPAILCGSISDEINDRLSKKLPVTHRHSTVPVELVAFMSSMRDPANRSLDPVYVRPPDAKKQTGFTLSRN